MPQAVVSKTQATRAPSYSTCSVVGPARQKGGHVATDPCYNQLFLLLIPISPPAFIQFTWRLFQ